MARAMAIAARCSRHRSAPPSSSSSLVRMPHALLLAALLLLPFPTSVKACTYEPLDLTSFLGGRGGTGVEVARVGIAAAAAAHELGSCDHSRWDMKKLALKARLQGGERL